MNATLRSDRAGCLFFQANDKIDGLSIDCSDGTSKMFPNDFTINKLELDVGISVLNIIECEPDDDNSIIVFRTLYNCQNEILLPNNKEITGCNNITRSTWKSTPACACFA
ncbi:Hypothetical predicted protein [Cloeon dipterum]|uniref:Uncharacterized protein n=1 Tax=Cloeon dipterum TaxID=197152 RepID=A0A8S1E3A1_9INSE|nr:Hypothetical predicted protein [Cloeon dipterum]